MIYAFNANYYKSIYMTTRYPSLNQNNFSSSATFNNEQKLFRSLPDEVFMYTYVHDNCAFIPTRNAKV